jgi:hypothetical protein
VTNVGAGYGWFHLLSINAGNKKMNVPISSKLNACASLGLNLMTAPRRIAAQRGLRTSYQWSIALFAALFLAACATDRSGFLTIEQKLADQDYAIKEAVSQTSGKVVSWSYIDDTHLIIDSVPKNSYLLTLKSPSFDLSTAVNVEFTTNFNRLTDQDKIIVSSPSGVSRHHQIASLHRLEKSASDAG